MCQDLRVYTKPKLPFFVKSYFCEENCRFFPRIEAGLELVTFHLRSKAVVSHSRHCKPTALSFFIHFYFRYWRLYWHIIFNQKQFLLYSAEPEEKVIAEIENPIHSHSLASFLSFIILSLSICHLLPLSVYLYLSIISFHSSISLSVIYLLYLSIIMSFQSFPLSLSICPFNLYSSVLYSSLSVNHFHYYFLPYYLFHSFFLSLLSHILLSLSLSLCLSIFKSVVFFFFSVSLSCIFLLSICHFLPLSLSRSLYLSFSSFLALSASFYQIILSFSTFLSFYQLILSLSSSLRLSINSFFLSLPPIILFHTFA